MSHLISSIVHPPFILQGNLTWYGLLNRNLITNLSYIILLLSPKSWSYKCTLKYKSNCTTFVSLNSYTAILIVSKSLNRTNTVRLIVLNRRNSIHGDHTDME